MQQMGAQKFVQKGSQVLAERSSPTQLVCHGGQFLADLRLAADAAEQSDPDLQCLPGAGDQHL